MTESTEQTPPFDLFLFARTEDMARATGESGITGCVVDWEAVGKGPRQNAFGGHFETDTRDFLEVVRAACDGRVICRVNGPDTGAVMIDDIRAAVDAGADEILVPMVRSPGDVERALRAAEKAGTEQVGIMLETQAALDRLPELLELPVVRTFVGLNDLSIDRGDPNLFRPLVDGTLARIADSTDRPLGVAGLTRPGLGSPIPCRTIISALVAFRCTFTFLRRSFLNDVPVDGFAAAVAEIRDAIDDERRFGDPRRALAALARAVVHADPFFSQARGGHA